MASLDHREAAPRRPFQATATMGASAHAAKRSEALDGITGRRSSILKSASCSNLHVGDAANTAANHVNSPPAAGSNIRSKRRKPTFQSISIRSFAIDLGDHPDCSFGPPVSLGWNFFEEVRHTVDAYENEKIRLGCYNPQLTCKLSSIRRRDILLRAGYTPDQIDRAEREVAKVKRQRAATSLLMPVSRLHEAIAFRTVSPPPSSGTVRVNDRHALSAPVTALPQAPERRDKASASLLPGSRRPKLRRSWSFRSVDATESVATLECNGPEGDDYEDVDDGRGRRA